MNKPLLHIFRNTPFGRETLLQSAYLCRRLKLPLSIYRPEFKSFLFYFDTDVVQIDLDGSYLTNPESAEDHIRDILNLQQLDYSPIRPISKSASTLPDLPTHFAVMTCPRSMTKDTRKIALGSIGLKVRRIVNTAPFPIFLPAPVFKPWDKLAVLYGGSVHAAGALRLALKIQQRSNAPLQVFARGDQQELEKQLRSQGFSDQQIASLDWHFLTGPDTATRLFNIPHDSLVLLGAYGKGHIKETLFGSTMEKVQHHLPNSMLVVGPKCRWIVDPPQ